MNGKSTIKGHCSRCGDVTGFTTDERQLEDNLYEVCIICPECETWYHSYYINDNLKELKRQILELGKKISINSFVKNSKGYEVPITAAAKRRYQEYFRLHDEYQTQYIQFQNETRSARGATVPEVKENADNIPTEWTGSTSA